MAETATAAAEDAAEFHDADLDALSELESPAPSEPETPPAEAPERPTEQKPAEAEQEPKAPSAPAPTTPAATFKIRGRDYTAEQIASNPDLLRDLTQTYEQFPHLTRRQQELADQIRQMQGQPQPEQPGQQAPRPYTPGSMGIGNLKPQEITNALMPVAEATVKAGWIEQELLDYFPVATTQFMLHRDLLYDVRAALQGVLQREAARDARGYSDDVRTRFNSTLDSLADEDDVFKPLKSDPEARKAFTEYMVALNPPTETGLDREFIARQWFAHNNGPILEALRQARPGAPAPARVENRRRQAAVAAGAPGSAGTTGQPAAEEFFGADLLPEGFKFPKPRR